MFSEEIMSHSMMKIRRFCMFQFSKIFVIDYDTGYFY